MWHGRPAHVFLIVNAPSRKTWARRPCHRRRSRLYFHFMPLRILVLGDIVGRPGRQIVAQKLPPLVKARNIDLVVANSENIAGGSGITTNLFHKIRSYGVDVVTLGDHIYKRADIIPTLQTSERIV